MARHDDLLNQGPREAPEAETAEEKSTKLGLKSAGGAVAGGGVVAAKAGATTPPPATTPPALFRPSFWLRCSAVSGSGASRGP